VTFVALMNLGSSASPRFSADYKPERSHIDLFGVAPYPCRTHWPKCHYDMIDRFVGASRDAGVPLNRIVPTYQAFGGGDWSTDSGDAYRLPSAFELWSISNDGTGLFRRRPSTTPTHGANSDPMHASPRLPTFRPCSPATILPAHGGKCSVNGAAVAKPMARGLRLSSIHASARRFDSCASATALKTQIAVAVSSGA
jgi:hypothetical protein